MQVGSVFPGGCGACVAVGCGVTVGVGVKVGVRVGVRVGVSVIVGVVVGFVSPVKEIVDWFRRPHEMILTPFSSGILLVGDPDPQVNVRLPEPAPTFARTWIVAKTPDPDLGSEVKKNPWSSIRPLVESVAELKLPDPKKSPLVTATTSIWSLGY